MGRFGIYGVAIFYILSGLTLFLVYYEKMDFSYSAILSFLIKRFFRIFPLLWLVTLVSIILSNKTVNFKDLLLNVSGLFGFIAWDKYIATGAWSIGNELVFYAFFPLFVLFSKKMKPLMLILSLSIAIIYIYFAFFKLTYKITLAEQWAVYINPINQVFLFLGGFLIGLFLYKIRVKNYILVTLFLMGVSLFTFYPTEGDMVSTVTRFNRLIFTTCCFIFCFCFYKVNLKLPDILHQSLSLLGEISYSVYLLHPIVFSLISIILTYCTNYPSRLPDKIKAILVVILAITMTLFVSYYVYKYFEKYFMKFGRMEIK
jgi:peptidoglycan/LPS O-acetylase OafA/YrhL